MATPAPACTKALRDATARWPHRSRASDGIMGDARHQKRKSDHNLGNAVDITHDPASGCDGDVISALALQDPRVTYVIWNRRIYSKARAREGWRPYRGTNAHTHHCHISIRANARGDLRDWPWAPSAGTSLPAPPPVHTPARPTATAARPPPPRPSEGTAYAGVSLHRGMHGVAVRRVQARLRALGWEIGVDGVFGQETHDVVRVFQRRRGLDDDGIVGRRTWQALFG